MLVFPHILPPLGALPPAASAQQLLTAHNKL